MNLNDLLPFWQNSRRAMILVSRPIARKFTKISVFDIQQRHNENTHQSGEPVLMGVCLLLYGFFNNR